MSKKSKVSKNLIIIIIGRAMASPCPLFQPLHINATSKENFRIGYLCIKTAFLFLLFFFGIIERKGERSPHMWKKAYISESDARTHGKMTRRDWRTRLRQARLLIKPSLRSLGPVRPGNIYYVSAHYNQAGHKLNSALWFKPIATPMMVGARWQFHPKSAHLNQTLLVFGLSPNWHSNSINNQF